MAEYARKNGQGVLYKNDVEEGSNKPNNSGSFLWNGQELRIAGWVAKRKDGTLVTDKNGNPMLNIQVSLANEGDSKGTQPARPARGEPSVF